MKIIYRISPYLSTHPNPLGVNKHDIVNKCLESFGDHENITFLNDSFKGLSTKHEVIDCSGMGNVGTFHKQIELACELSDNEHVFFVEDDYLWQPNAVKIIDEALYELKLITPYDHPGHYTEVRFKHEPKRMRLVNNRTYREAPSTTLTFACQAWVIKQNKDLILSYGVRDHELFQALPVDLWVSVPSLATHLVEGLIAPNVEWAGL